MSTVVISLVKIKPSDLTDVALAHPSSPEVMAVGDF